MNFQSLTQYIKVLENDSLGEWHKAEKKDGVITLPYVSYTSTVREFIRELYNFAKNNNQYDMYNYKEVLEQKGIIDYKEMQECDIDAVDAQTILCMMMGVVRADRFSEGTLMSYLQDGYFDKWLKKLQKIDKTIK